MVGDWRDCDDSLSSITAYEFLEQLKKWRDWMWISKLGDKMENKRISALFLLRSSCLNYISTSETTCSVILCAGKAPFLLIFLSVFSESLMKFRYEEIRTKFREYLLLFSSESFVFTLLSRNLTIRIIQNYKFICWLVWVWNLVSLAKGRMLIEVVWEQSA
jgi:hypothetical protein